MSHPRLHESLVKLFTGREVALLDECLTHPEFEAFNQQQTLDLPLRELVQAFTHTSFSHEYEVPHQEMLEFLGDSVLQLILTEELFKRFPSEKEGRLSKKRSSLVNEKSLSVLGNSLGFETLILVGKGEFKKNLNLNESVIADTFEALMAQVYRHRGYEFTKIKFIGWLEKVFPDVWSMSDLEDFDYKSKLQEKSLATFKKLPQYTAEAQAEKFLVKLFLNEVEVASGVYGSKKGGEKDLAEIVIKKGLI